MTTNHRVEITPISIERPDRLIRFWINQRILGFESPKSPCFDSIETIRWFESKLRASNGYLEFGTGGSTYLAAKYGIPFICTDSDRFFLSSVKNKILRDGFFDPTKQTYRFAGIGLTGPWGYPVVVGKPSLKRQTQFANYSDPPLQCMCKDVTIDLVLIDGRFRVACALKIAKSFRHCDHWTLVVDDYKDRPHYHLLENFLRLESQVGQMAVFTKRASLDIDYLNQAIDVYQYRPE